MMVRRRNQPAGVNKAAASGKTEGVHDGLPFASRVMGPAAAENGRFFQTCFLPIKSLNLTTIVAQEIPSRMMTTVLNRGKCE